MAAASAELNVGSPRVKAAMKVLGIKPQEVSKIDPAHFDGKDGRQKMFSQKRQQLIRDINEMVAKSPDVTDGGKKEPLDASAERERKTKAFLDVIEAQEHANFEKLQVMAKKEVQKIVIGELSSKAASHAGQEKQKQSHARLREMRSLRDQEAAARKKEAEKKQEKNEKVREAATVVLAKRNAEMTETLRKANERCTNKLESIASERVVKKEENDERRRLLADRREIVEADLEHGREKAYGVHVDKHEGKQQWLAEQLASRVSNSAAIAQAQQESMDRVKVKQEQNEIESRLRFLEAVDRHGKAADVRNDNAKVERKLFKVTNEKRKQAHQGRYDRIQAELEKSPGIKLSASAAPGSPTFVVERSDLRKEKPGRGHNPLLKSQSDSRMIPVVDHRTDHADIVSGNRERLRRAHAYEMSEQLDKLHNMRLKVQIMNDAKTEADKRRMCVLRNTSLEKMHLTERVGRCRDSQDPEKMNRVLEDMGPDVEAIDEINKLLGSMNQPLMAGGTPAKEEK